MLFSKFRLNTEWKMAASAVIVVVSAPWAMSSLTAPLPDTFVAPSFAAFNAGPAQPDLILDLVSQNATAPEAAPSMPAIAATPSEDCTITLDVLPDENAMIGLTLIAPCLPNSDVLVSHAGLVFSAKTMASGSLFLSLPALTPEAKVVVQFSSGESAEAAISMPDVRSLRRFAVQWPESDGFSLHAYEGNAGFDDPGHIWADNLATPLPARPQETGYLTLLGDRSTNLPMLAQVYTYPAQTEPEIIVEAAVTENNCGFDLMGDAISSVAGKVEKTEITVAIPDCTAIGDFVQLPGLAPELKLALAN